MNECDFWNLIDSPHDSITVNASVSECLFERLYKLPDIEIIDFARHYRDACRQAYDERLWMAAITISHHFCSDDLFSDFRTWLVGQGKKTFDNALNNPDSLANLEQIQNVNAITEEGFLLGAVALNAYKAKSGRPDFPESFEMLPPPELKNADIWDGKMETLKLFVPLLYAKANEK